MAAWVASSGQELQCPVVSNITAQLAADSTLNQFLFFHGTSTENIQKIISEGFDPSRSSGRNLFGKGTYFAENASKADYYHASAKPGQVVQILLARVALGNAYVARQALPPTLSCPPDSGAALPFDSVIGEKREQGGVVDHREYVIYDRYQALPAYIVEYRHRSAC
eukprot:CAMPEP_0179164260 /NCGR_PEP_ID=MMETSP0796-20121207/80598_1 /TAXON_ID=73915 /ORGANISM="Pyrodinium bahamense, Strain pbaha01" /LENGTH=165 /DNA_ID=CAMNT_0020866685 /DNA_START=29 /DNA_END=523 /DNA_ORIENTATION=-